MRSTALRSACACAILASMIIAIAGCGGRSTGRGQPPVAIERGDASVTDGMLIEPYPGPRAEAYVSGYSAPLKFGDTRDFFAFILQPENLQRLESLYVQDCARIDWQKPSNAVGTFVDARTAFYVAWQPLKGMMGPTFASFAARSAAEDFVRRHGGEILEFDAITPQLVAELDYSCPVPTVERPAGASYCVTLPAAASSGSEARKR